MGRVASKEWPKGTCLVVPDTRRPDGFWSNIQTEQQERINTTLRDMYAELSRLPLSPRLTLLVRKIEAHWEAPTLHG
jgi:hypothetical protein